ncbi:acid protease [Peniophora sp. CONT]|nr:acid protease [Peniophora sp. CONT]
MFPFVALLAFALSQSAYALPYPVIQFNNASLARLPVAKTIAASSALHLVTSDRARTARLKAMGTAAATGTPFTEAALASVPAVNQAVTYTVNVSVGEPATIFSLIVDSGSSNTWVGAGTPYEPTSTSENTGDLVEVQYGSGLFLGEEFTDTVTLGNNITVANQSIGVATESEGFNGVDGILGIGPVALTQGTLSSDSTLEIPTFTDNLFSEGLIDDNLVAVSFEPTTTADATNGELTFGGIDTTKFNGNITYAPITATTPSSEFWGIDQSVSYGNQTILNLTAGIVDTGTTLVLIATDAFDAYQTATGAVLDQTTGLLTITDDQLINLDSLYFDIAGTTFELTPNAQLWPRALNTAIGGTADGIYLIVSDLGTPSGQGLDFINGQSFLERFYAVFDTTNQQVGIATTDFTTATSN